MPAIMLAEEGLAEWPRHADNPARVMDESSVRLVASDMDGTLLNSRGCLPSGFFEAFEALAAKGIHFAAASGRQYHGLRKTFAPVADRMLFVAENGAYVARGSDVWSVLDLDAETVFRLVCEIRAIEDVHIVLAGEQRAYIDSVQPDFVREARKYYTECAQVEDLLNVTGDRFLKLAIYDFRGAAANSYPRLLHWQDQLKLAVSGARWMDVNRQGADKGSALALIQQRLHLSPGETMAFGDQMNDLEMMGRARWSYAVGNAVPEIRRAAAFSAPSNDEEGVMKVLKGMLSARS